MAGKILEDLRQERFDEVAVSAREYLRKTSAGVIKKNAKVRDNFEIFLLKLLKCCTEILERSDHAEKVMPLVELSMEPLNRVRLCPSDLPEMAFEKVLIHLATRVFACERLATAVDVLECLYVRVDQLARRPHPPSSLPSLLEAIHKTAFTCASRLEKTLSRGPTAHRFYLLLLSLYVRFQVLAKDGWETAVKRMLSVATSIHQSHPEVLHCLVLTTIENLPLSASHHYEEGSESHQGLPQWDTYLQLLFHLASLSQLQNSKETYILLQQKVAHVLSLSGREQQKKNCLGLQSSKAVWVCCLSLCNVVHQLKLTNDLSGDCCRGVSDAADELRQALPHTVCAHPSTSCLLEQLNEFRKFVDSADYVKVCSSGDHLSFLYSAVEVLIISTQFLDKCRRHSAGNNAMTKKLSMMLLKTLYACLDCHLALLKSGEGSIEVLRESSASHPTPTSDDVECMPLLMQLGELLGNHPRTGFDPQEHQWLANLAYNFAVAYRQQDSLAEAAIVLQFSCQELLNWCSKSSGDEEDRYLLCLEQAKFFKKFSVLCSCKRKCGGAHAVLEDVRSLLRSLPVFVLTASSCSSAVVHEWARANSVLEEGEQESLCDVLQDVGAGETLKWLWMELKEYQSLDSLSLQLMCLDALLSLLDKDEKENLFLANVLVERARVQRGLPDQRCLCLKTCSDAVALLENWPQEGGAPFIKGKAFFWQAVILHEQVVSRLEPLEGADEVHCVDSGPPLLTPNHVSLLLAEDASHALELALQQWEGVQGAVLEGEGPEFLDLLVQALALATLLQKTSLSMQAVSLLLRHSPAESVYPYWAIASLCHTVAQHRWDGITPMLEACLSATGDPGPSEGQDEELSTACFSARVALCAVMVNTGQSERAARFLLHVVSHKLFQKASSPAYHTLAVAKLVCSVVLKQPKHAYNPNRSEFSPSEYLEYLLSGTDETATLAGVAHHTPGPSQLEADAVHILTQLADKVIQETTGEEGAVPSPPNVTSKDLALANPWSILQSLLLSLHSLVGALIQQGRVDLARYYINHGLLTSSQYALRHWFCQFLLHLIHLKQLCGEFDDSQCHLNTVSQLLHLRSSKDPLDHEAEGTRDAFDLNPFPDVSSRSLVAQYVCLYTQWCLSEGVPEKADKMIGQFETPGPKSAEEAKVQRIWKDILTLLERTGGPCAGISSVAQTGSPLLRPVAPSCSKTARSRKKHREPLPSTPLCTTKELSRILALSRCDLHLALHTWDQLVVFADAALQQDTSTCTPCVTAQIHFAQGVGLFHQQQQRSCSTVASTKKTPPKSQRTKKKKKGGVGAGRMQTSPSSSAPPAVESHVEAFLRAHALCSTEMPAVLMREVCRWLSACATDDTGRLPALFLAQSGGVSVYHRLVGRCLSSEDQNVSTGMLRALSAYLGLAPECPSREKKQSRLLQQYRPLLGIPTWPALKEVLTLLPKDWVICLVSTSPINPDSLLLCRLHHSGPPVLSTVNNWSGMLTDFDSVMAASLESMKLKQKVAWRNDRLRVNEELKMKRALCFTAFPCLQPPLAQSLLCQLEDTCLGPAKSLLIGLPSCHTATSWNREDVKHLAEETALPAHLVVSLLQCSDMFQEGDLEKLGGQLRGRSGQEGLIMGSSLLSAVGDSDLDSETERCPVVLITDRLTHYLPWESLPCLHSHSVTRMPSLLFAANHFNKLQDLRPVPTDKSFCILNPQGDLSRTEQTFAPWLKKQGWRGLTGKAPSKSQLVTAVTENDLFVYIGHGGGQEYISSHERSKLSCRAVMVLMGCKTAKLTHCGQLDGRGIALDYLLAGCPALVGNLWDVTDKDIDRYTKALLESITNPSKSDWTLQCHVATTRAACDLRYLTGSAPVVYGLPVHFSSK